MKLPEKIEARLAELGAGVEDLRTSEGWTRWLRVRRRFHRYSLQNQLLISFQRPDATDVAGFAAWKKLHRKVRRGEKGIAIMAPVPVPVRDENVVQELRLYFKTAYVFDVAQTEQIEGLPVLYDPPVWPESTELDDPHLVERLADVVRRDTGLAVTWMDLPGEMRGVLRREERTLAIQHDLAPAAQVGVLLHELGHYFDPYLVAGGSYSAERPACELVAESAMWLVADSLGVRVEDEVIHYLASWEGDTDELLRLSARIDAAAHAVAGLLDVVPASRAA